MARLAWALLAAIVLVGPAVAQGGESGFYEVNGIEYYYATGPYGAGHFLLGADASGADQEPFTGCSWAKLRPDNNKGRVQVLGTWFERELIVDISDFPPIGQDVDSIAPNTPVAADASGLGQAWPATMAVTSQATVDVGGVPLTDPVSGSANFTASWFVTPNGFRDDVDGAIQDATGQPFEPGDEAAGEPGAFEMHMRLTSSGTPQGPATWDVAAPGGGLSLAPQDDYVELYAVPNERLGGTGVLQAQASSLAPAGANDFTVTVYAPDGTMLGVLPFAPDLLQAASGSLQFPLDQFGAYYVAVEGKVSLTQYDLSLEQQTPDAFEMDFWWDDVRPGYDGLLARQECSDLLGGPVMEAFVAPRPDPTPFDWTFSVMTVASGLVALAVSVAFILAAYNAIAARRAIRDT